MAEQATTEFSFTEAHIIDIAPLSEEQQVAKRVRDAAKAYNQAIFDAVKFGLLVQIEIVEHKTDRPFRARTRTCMCPTTKTSISRDL